MSNVWAKDDSATGDAFREIALVMPSSGGQNGTHRQISAMMARRSGRISMRSQEQSATSIFDTNLQTGLVVVVLVVVFAALVLAAAAQGQTFTTLHAFTGGADGSTPYAGLSMDRAGNLYGTASYGGNKGGACGGGCGTVFRMVPKGSSWVFYPLYAFSGADGDAPQARVIIGPDGNLYGTTSYGGAYSKGVVFRLQPPAVVCKAFLCPWRETVLYSFAGGSDGANPEFGDLTLDLAGNIYGTTPNGGSAACTGGCGVVYELSPSNGGWTEKILYSFQGGQDGAYPYAGVVFDNAGNLYGTTFLGGAQYDGTVYELTPSGSGWTESVLYSFGGGQDGFEVYSGVILDSAGNLYGASFSGAAAVYELSPSNGGWTFKALHDFGAYEGSVADLTFDSAGNLYGTLAQADQEVFRLTPSNGGWTLTGFSGGVGAFPLGNVVLDASGNLYTTAADYGGGFVFEVTP